MVIVFKPNAPQETKAGIKQKLENQGYMINEITGIGNTIFGIIGDTSALDINMLRIYDCVEKVLRVSEPFKRANRAFHPDDSIINVAGVPIGGRKIQVMAGPCSVESEEQIISIAEDVKKSGATFLRGGAFKPRTSPYAFQGLGCEGIDLLLAAKKITGLPIVSELMAINQLEIFNDVDVIQIGARNMQNFTLLKELGHCGKPILLKRGLANTVKELLMSAEYIMAGGNENIILCERGIRSFDNFTRNVLDLSAVPYLKKVSHLPVIVDPSHATGLAWMVPTMSKAAIASGADGIMVEVHNNPQQALCDGEQSITPSEFDTLMKQMRKYAEIEGKII
jgi:3-deoxy-7-phosphoheptulonate synthase